MSKTIVFFLFFSFSFVTVSHADWITTPPQEISATYSYSFASVFTSYDPATGTFLAAWADGNNNQYPTYSFYSSDTGWSPISTITTVSSAAIPCNVVTSCDPQTGKFIATWTDSNTDHPASAIYTPGVGWGSVDLLSTSTVVANTANSYDSTTGQFFVTWADSGNNNYPSYAFYTPNVGWSSASTISIGARAANVYTTFDSTANRHLAVWVDISTGNPMYAFYSSNTWSPAAILASADIDDDILCSCNSSTGQFVATWSDINQNFYPFYSVYAPGSGWGPISTITTASGVKDNVAISCDLLSGQYLATWSNRTNGNPTYSFYTPGIGWSEPGVISTAATTSSDVITCFNSTSEQFLAAWADNSDPNLISSPVYSFFIDPIPNPPALLSFTAEIVYNRYLNRKEIVHKLMWKPPTDASSIGSYRIYRNDALIATVLPSDVPIYYDRNRAKKRTDVYTIVSVNAQGKQSAPLTISL